MQLKYRVLYQTGHIIKQTHSKNSRRVLFQVPTFLKM